MRPKIKVAIAMDSFKGSLDSIAAGRAVAKGVRRAVPGAQCEVRPLADGGEGTIDALVAGLGGRVITESVEGPYLSMVRAKYGLLPGGVAVMELAQASGLTLLSEKNRNPLRTSTRGFGELIGKAIERGARKFIVGIGGSATNDGGAGMLQELGFGFLDRNGSSIFPGGIELRKLAKIVPVKLRGVTFRVACDVANPLCGPNGASAVFGPQKGATPGMVKRLDAALAHYAEIAGGDPDAPGAGAAGGVGYAFKTFLGAKLVPGVDLVLKETHLGDAIRDADLVITGEGRLDGQTVMGKAPIGVAKLAKRYGKPVIALAGCLGDGVEAVNRFGIDAYFPILRSVTTLEAALDAKNAAENLAKTAEQAVRCWRIAARH